jgi:hypothetical protein
MASVGIDVELDAQVLPQHLVFEIDGLLRKNFPVIAPVQ